MQAGSARQTSLHLDSERHAFLATVLFRREFGADAIYLQSKGLQRTAPGLSPLPASFIVVGDVRAADFDPKPLERYLYVDADFLGGVPHEFHAVVRRRRLTHVHHTVTERNVDL